MLKRIQISNAISLNSYEPMRHYSGATELNTAGRRAKILARWTVFTKAAIGLYRENAIAVRVIDRSAYDATSRVHAHRQRKKLVVSTQRLLHLLPASLRCCALIS